MVCVWGGCRGIRCSRPPPLSPSSAPRDPCVGATPCGCGVRPCGPACTFPMPDSAVRGGRDPAVLARLYCPPACAPSPVLAPHPSTLGSRRGCLQCWLPLPNPSALARPTPHCTLLFMLHPVWLPPPAPSWELQSCAHQPMCIFRGPPFSPRHVSCLSPPPLTCIHLPASPCTHSFVTVHTAPACCVARRPCFVLFFVCLPCPLNVFVFPSLVPRACALELEPLSGLVCVEPLTPQHACACECPGGRAVLVCAGRPPTQLGFVCGGSLLPCAARQMNGHSHVVETKSIKSAQ